MKHVHRSYNHQSKTTRRTRPFPGSVRKILGAARRVPADCQLTGASPKMTLAKFRSSSR